MIKTGLKLFVELTGNPFASKMLKQISSSKISKPLVRPFSKVYHINETEMEKPLEKYHSLHAFFTRKLKPNLRPIDATPYTLTSPVDGIVNGIGKVLPNQAFYIKDRLYRLNDIFGDTKHASTYHDGYYYILYLSPSHYHRIHYPIDGKLVQRYALGDTSYPVNNLGLRWGDKPFSTNYRIISEIDTEAGKVAFVKVGALNINSIQLTNSSDICVKGEEAGYFSFGSTVLLFIENKHAFQNIVPDNTEIKLGQALGKWKNV